MAKFTRKISNLIKQQVPEFVLADHPKFLEFVETYYRFMESAEITIENVQATDGIAVETETAQENNIVLDGSKIDTDRTQLDAGDKILLEDSNFGKFTRGETVTGQTSNATAIVLSEDLPNNRLFISAQDKFIQDEIILGSTSTAKATISNYKPNPVNNIQDLLNFRDPDKAISNFLTKFRNEFLNTLPEILDVNVDKRKLIKNIRSVYRAKGTQRGHEVFFRFLFNEDSQTLYPRENILRVSDGKFDTTKILRAIGTTGKLSDLVGRTITGQTSNATAIVENVFQFQIGSNTVTEFILNEETILGTFITAEEIRGTSTDTSDTFIKGIVTGIPNVVTITNDGSLLSPKDDIPLTGGGTTAIIQVGNTGSGPITEVLIDDAGAEYVIGDTITFNNLNTGGGGVTAKVSVVNGGFTPEDSTSTTSDHIVLEDETVRGDVYTGDKIVQEAGSGTADITDIRIINSGGGYKSLPTALITSDDGVGAKIIPYGPEIGRLLNIKKIEPGAGYEASPSPTIKLPSSIVVKDASGSFTIGEVINGLDISSTVVTATVVSFINSILKVRNSTGEFAENTTITGQTTTTTGVVMKNDLATATVNVGAVVDTEGQFINEDGFVSENTMRIQDSLYYQDFSYVIKVGRTINDWRDSFKKTMHTAGFYLAAQVEITNKIDLKTRPRDQGGQLVPFSTILNTLFASIIGRRLGTNTDGTTLRANPHEALSDNLQGQTLAPYDPATRDVTITRAPINIRMMSRVTRFIEPTKNGKVHVKFGFASTGPYYHSLNRYANTRYGTTTSIHNTVHNGVSSGITFRRLSEILVTGTRTSLDGTPGIFVLTSHEEGQKVKINFTYPAEVFTFNPVKFSNTKGNKKFSNTTVKWSQTTQAQPNP